MMMLIKRYQSHLLSSFSEAIPATQINLLLPLLCAQGISAYTRAVHEQLTLVVVCEWRYLAIQKLRVLRGRGS